MSISGDKREQKSFKKSVGIFEGSVVIINPSIEEYSEVLGITLPEESKATEYLGESKEGNTYLRLNIWLKDIKTGEIFQAPVSFYLEDKIRENKEGTKIQYINNIGSTTWADDENNLPDWFKKYPYRKANTGEEELYEFLRTWINIDTRKAEADLSIDFKKLMKGNVKELSEQIDGEYAGNAGFLATVITREKANTETGEIEKKEYQGIYNKAFLPPYAIKNFRLVDYSNPDVIAKISAKKPKNQKAYEKFVLKVVGEYGCRDAYVLKDLEEFDPSKFITSSDKVIDPASSEY